MAVGAVLGTALGPVSSAHATHFRYAQVTWQPNTSTANAIDFTVTAAFRRNGYSGSHADGFPQIGDSVAENIGATALDFGDSTSTGTLTFTVTSFDVAQNFWVGVATASHTYASAGNVVAAIDSGNRTNECSSPEGHINNFGLGYRIETEVDVGSGNSSPVSSLPPIIQCVQGTPCTFQIPTSDNELDTLSFRLSTPGESGIATQPGAGNGCTGGNASVSSTGLYSWDTTGCNLATTVCGSGFRTLYSTQVMIEEPAPKGRTALDFFIELVDCPAGNVAPTFDAPTPACGSTIATNPGTLASFTVQASDADSGDSVSLNASLPVGSAMSPNLPSTGNPVSSAFSWTPTSGDIGQNVVTFTANDNCGVQTLCSITIDVSDEICNNIIDDDGDLLADCADPDCVAHPNCLATPTSTATATDTSTSTATATPTAPPATDTATATATATAADTDTPAATATDTVAATPTPTLGPGGSALILRRIKLKANVSRSNKPNGRVILKGVLDVNKPLQDFAADVASAGITVLLSGAGGINQSFGWLSSECVAKEPRPGRLSLRCNSADRQLKAIFRPVSGVIAPNVFQVTIVARRRDFSPPLTTEPTTVTLETVGLDPVDSIGETGTCKLRGKRSHVIVCKEKGIFINP